MLLRALLSLFLLVPFASLAQGGCDGPACADHEVAKGVRDALTLNPPKGKLADDVVYAQVDGPSLFAQRGYKKEQK